MTRVWVDVEDLFEYANGQSRPSGIQRLAFELCAALVDCTDRVGFLRHHPASNSFRVVPWSEVQALYTALTAPSASPPVTKLPVAATTRSGPSQRLREIAFRLPPDMRLPLTRVYVQQRAAFGAMRDLARASMRRPRRMRRKAAGGEAGVLLRDVATEGDVLLAPGAHWYHPNYAGLVDAARRTHGLRFAMLVYDLVPLLRPEWCETGLIRIFSAFAHSVMPLADIMLTISHASAADIERYAQRQSMTLRARPIVLPIGTGFQQRPPATGPLKSVRPAEPYVLAVSTIEARKNHLLLFHVWRRMLDDMPRDRVPTLVFAGRQGWLVDDLMVQLRNAAFLGGKIMLTGDIGDPELQSLYAGCLFTVFPSFYEGWGLPVTESLAFGCPCLVSNATSVPEAGGDLAEYFDPHDVTQAYAVIRRAIEQPEQVAGMRRRIAATFRPIPWRDTAQALLSAL